MSATILIRRSGALTRGKLRLVGFRKLKQQMQFITNSLGKRKPLYYNPADIKQMEEVLEKTKPRVKFAKKKKN